MKAAPRRVIIHLVPRPANVGVDHTMAALSRLGTKVRRQQRRKAGAA